MRTELPTYTTESCIESAIVFAVESHYPQTDRGGVPYIHHPLRVMEAVRAAGYGLTHQIVALLHDVVEDTSTTIEEVELYFGKDVANAVEALTRREGEGYFSEYLPRVLQNKVARVVKYYDATDNFNRSDGNSFPGEAKKYSKIIARCIEAGVPAL